MSWKTLNKIDMPTQVVMHIQKDRDTGEYRILPSVAGVYDENSAYYTDNMRDAWQTFSLMAKDYKVPQELDVESQVYQDNEGTKCPCCKLTDIEGGPVNIEGNSAWQSMTCSNCFATWDDVYTFTSMRNLVEGEAEKE